MGLMFACPRVQAQDNQTIRNAKIRKHSNIVKLLIENGASI